MTLVLSWRGPSSRCRCIKFGRFDRRVSATACGSEEAASQLIFLSELKLRPPKTREPRARSTRILAAIEVAHPSLRHSGRARNVMRTSFFWLGCLRLRSGQQNPALPPNTSVWRREEADVCRLLRGFDCATNLDQWPMRPPWHGAMSRASLKACGLRRGRVRLRQCEGSLAQ